MIIDNTTNVKTNLKGSVEFSVSDDSAKIFSFLSNFLYKEKERSVMTELCSNALDAHKMVGKDTTPIKVHLPTDLQKEFRVRDFGPGLTEVQVYQFLTKYGSSSKTGSNDFIGGFGIGSKSPAAVTDTWTINSHNAGFETSYLIHVNDRGIPSINKLYSKPSSETGLEVVVPTKTVREWHNDAHKVFEHYDVLPDIKGASQKVVKSEFDHKFNGLVAFKRGTLSTYYPSGKVLMNRRSYEIDLKKLGINSIFKIDFYLPFNTSELSVSLSREDLAYDSRTVEVIKSRYADLTTAIVAEWKKEVSVLTDIFEYQLAAGKFLTKHFISGDGGKILAKTAKDTFASTVDFGRLSNFSIDLNDENLSVQYVEGDICKTLKKGRYGIGHNGVKLSCKNYGSDLKSLSFVCKYKNELTFVLRDVNDAPSRVKLAIDNGSIEHAVILDKAWFDIIPSSFNKITASSLDKPKIEREKREQIESELFQRVGNTFRKVKESELDTKLDWVYVRMTNASTVSSIIDPHDTTFVNSYLIDNVSFSVIYLKPGTKAPSWAMTRVEWLQKEYDKLYAKKDNIILSKKYFTIKSFYSYSLLGMMFNNPEKFSKLKSGTVAGDFLAEISNLKASKPSLTYINDFDRLKLVANFLGKSEDIKQLVTSVDYQSDMEKAYPMLKVVNSRSSVASDFISTIVDYILLCEK